MNTVSTAPKAKSPEPKRAIAQSVNEQISASNADPRMRAASCACGGGCARCNNKKNNSRGILQAKLEVGAPDDAYEQEADRVADEILATPSSNAISSKAPPLIQRLTSQTAGYRTTAPPSVEHALSGSGRSLDTKLQQDMSQRFGQDFSEVRIHTGAAAEQSAQEIKAHAYTVGRNIVFSAGQFSPSSQQGKRLLAHELTHVVQQSENRSLNVQRYIAADVLTTQITRTQAEEMTDAELDQEIQRLRSHLGNLERASTDYIGASENLSVLESVVSSRVPSTHHRRPQSLAHTVTAATASATESVLPVEATLINSESTEEANRMTVEELSEEIVRLRSVITTMIEGSFENLANQERLSVFERVLADRDAPVLEHHREVRDARDHLALITIGDVFLSGFTSGGEQTVPPGEVYDFFHHDLLEHPLAFADGCDEGVGLGFIAGANNLLETATSIIELIERVVMLVAENPSTISELRDDAMHELIYQTLGENLFTSIVPDSTSYLERRHSYERQVNQIIAGIQRFAEELAHDPTIVLQWSGDLGLALGQSFGQSVTEDFLRATPHQQGVIVGRILGQILFEIVLQLVLAVATEGVGNAIRASTEAAHSIRVSAELTAIMREMAEASPTVRRLVRLAETGEEAADTTVDLVRVAEGTPDLPSASRVDSLDAIAHVDDAHVPGARAVESSEPVATTPEPSITNEIPSSDLATTPEPETRPRTARERTGASDRATPAREITTEELGRISSQEHIVSEDVDVLDRAVAGEQPHEQLEVFGEEDIADMRVTDRDRGVGGHDPDSTASREALRDSAGPRPTDTPRAWEGHHIIPWELREHPAVYEYELLIAGVDNPRATVAGRAINTEDNAVYLPSSSTVPEGEGMTIHRGSHPRYTSWVESRLDQLWAEYNYGGITLEEFGRRYEGLIGEFESRLISGEIGRVAPGGRRVLR